MVCSRVTEAGVVKYKDNYSGALTLDLVVVNGSLDTAEVLRQVSGKIRCACACACACSDCVFYLIQSTSPARTRPRFRRWR